MSSCDGSHCIIRVASVSDSLDIDHLHWVRDKVGRECEMMRWISFATNVPIPRVHYYDVNVPRPYMVTDKCDGTMLADAFGTLASEAKVLYQ